MASKYKAQYFSADMCDDLTTQLLSDEKNKFNVKKNWKKNTLKLYNLDDPGRYFTVSENCMQYIANSK